MSRDSAPPRDRPLRDHPPQARPSRNPNAPSHREQHSRQSRRTFLSWLAVSPWAVSALARAASPGSSLDLSGSLRRALRFPRRDFTPFPSFAETGVCGAGTYGLPEPEPLIRALASGVRLLDTSPDYRQGDVEKDVGWAAERSGEPVFIMTQIPVEAWEQPNRRVAFHRALRHSLGRLRRGQVEALLVRNAEPAQLQDPQFRDFARDVKESRLVGRFGASGHGPDLEKVLELAQEDDLLEIILFGTHLAGFHRVPELLHSARENGKLLIAMKTREAALWHRLPGWEREAERRRHAPWDGSWDPEFTRRALKWALEETPAHHAVLSLRRTEDAALLLGKG